MGIEEEISKIHDEMTAKLHRLVETSITKEAHEAATKQLHARNGELIAALTLEKVKVAERDDRLIDMASRNNAHVARIAELERQLALRS